MKTEPSDVVDDVRKLPKPRVKKTRWPFPILWIIPILAAVGAGFYYWSYRAEEGPEITIAFHDAQGLRVEDTPVSYRGVNVGKITGLTLSEDLRDALVHVRLNRSAETFARGGSLFWVVRPEISSGSISGLGTVISGPYIEARPGGEKEMTNFLGLDKPPIALGRGLDLILHAQSLEHLQPNSGVYYRGIQVGVVERLQLNSQATGIDVYLFIWSRYQNLVRTGSQFWSAPGAEVQGGIFSGVNVKLESLGTLISGAIAFATPDPPGDPAKEGAEYTLNPEAKKEWMSWSPALQINPAPSGEDDADSDVEAGQSAMDAIKKSK
jgi:paraquat-inducible protein B